MPLTCIYNVLDDIQEFCYVLTHTLQLHELVNYWTNQISVTRARVLRGVEELQQRGTSQNKYLHNHCEQRGYCLHNATNGGHRVNGMTGIPQSFQNGSVKHRFDVPSYLPPKNIHATSYVVQEDNPELKQRILSLEEDISRLIKTVENLSNQVHHDCSRSTPYVPKVIVNPPPPPPPPPPAPVSFPFKKKSRIRVLGDNNSATKSPMKVDMTKLLKGLKDVKLKHTEKSPGGTPMRQRSPRSQNDTVDLIKAALKKRFACIHPEDISNKENYNDSWESSPNFKS